MKPLLTLLLLPLALTSCKLVHIEGDFVLFKRGTPIRSAAPPSITWSPYGKTVTVTKTIVVESGQTLDGRLPNGKLTRLIAAPVLGDGSQKEGQKPLIIVKPGGTVRYYILDFPAADGVHLQSAPLRTTRAEGLEFRDVGEDALTVTGNGAVLIEGCRFQYATDKVIQTNGPAKVQIVNCQARKFARFARGCGTCGDSIAYDITLKNPVGMDGDTLLKLSTPKARGRIEGARTARVNDLYQVSGGAKVTVK